jgi:hypothetical protein
VILALSLREKHAVTVRAGVRCGRPRQGATCFFDRAADSHWWRGGAKLTKIFDMSGMQVAPYHRQRSAAGLHPRVMIYAKQKDANRATWSSPAKKSGRGKFKTRLEGCSIRSLRRFCAELADVADAGRDAAMIEIVE